MRRLVKVLANAGFFLLCFAQVPLMAGYWLLGDCAPAMGLTAALLPVAFLLSLVPGRIGGRGKTEAPVARASRGADPDPDRALRSEALPLPQRRTFPLRALLCLLVCMAVVAAVFVLPGLGEIWWGKRMAMGVILAAMLPLALKVAALGEGDSGSLTAAIILYVLAGIAGYVEGSELLNRWLTGFGLAFVVCAGLVMNGQSMTMGTAARAGVRPPTRMRRRNRMLLAIVGAVGALILYFDQIRTASIRAFRGAIAAVWRAFVWLSNLLLGGGEAPVEGAASGGEADMLAGLPAGEAGAFWKLMERALIWLGVLLGLVCLLLAAKKLWRLLVAVAKKISERLRRLTSEMSEEYRDEQESLLDWGEARREMSEGFRKRLARLTRREKKWEQMDERERVRFVVRSMYRRTPERESLRCMTIHEAATRLRTGQAAPEEVAQLYDRARYAANAPDMARVERLKKEAKV